MRAVIEESWLKQPVWYKLYKRELIQEIPFPVGKYHEDVFWTYQAVGNARKVSVFDTPCYHYVQRRGSIMSERYSMKRLDALEAKTDRVQYIQRHFQGLMHLAKRDLWFSCIYTRQMLLKYGTRTEKAEGAAIIKRVLHIYPIKLSCWDKHSVKQLIWLFMAKLSFESTCKLRNRLRIGM